MAGLLETAVTLRGSASFGAPEVMPVRLTLNAGASSVTVTEGMTSSVGGSFTDVTVSVQVVLAVAPSLSVTGGVMIALRYWLGNGVIVAVGEPALPPSTIFESGIRPW